MKKKPTKKQQKENLKLFKHGEQLTIFLMNIEAFSTKKGLDIAQRFLLAHQTLMAIDESTTIKSPTARRTKNVLKLRNYAKYRRILTGSPVTKSPLDLYTQCYFLDPYYLDFTSYYTFRNRYASMVDRNVGSHSFKLVTGYVRLDELNDKLNKFSYRVLKEDCLDLPDKVYMKRLVTMTPEQKKLYEEMKKYRTLEVKYSNFYHDLNDEKENIKFSDLELIFKDLKSLFEKRGFIINWKALEKQSLDETINALAMASPFSLEEKQILLEAKNLNLRKNKIAEILKTYSHDVFNNNTLQ